MSDAGDYDREEVGEEEEELYVFASMACLPIGYPIETHPALL
jgi:hypothetical protein